MTKDKQKEDLNGHSPENYHLSDIGLRKECDITIRLASYICKAPFAYLSFGHNAGEEVFAKIGVELATIPANLSLYHDIFHAGGIFEVSDIREDLRFAGHPLIQADPNIRFFAAVPVIDQSGNYIGYLCVLDIVPRNLSPEQKDALFMLAGQVLSHLEAARKCRELQRVQQELEQVSMNTCKQTEIEFETLSVAVRKSAAGILIRNEKNEIDWMNESFELMFGYKLEELQGGLLGNRLYGERTDQETIALIRQALIEKKPYEAEVLLYKKDGTPVWVFISSTPIFDEEGRLQRQVALVVDVTARKKSEEEIRLLSLVASKTGNGVVINDKNGRISWVNEAWEKIIGFKLEEVKGKRIGDLVKGDHTNLEELARVRQQANEGRPFYTELLNYRKDGSPVWLSISNNPIFNEKGEKEQEIEIVNDISERKRTEEELIKNREEALQLSQAKEALLSVMSHEIRTPINAVIGLTQLLLEDSPSPSQLESLHILKFSGENLLMLINDILDFTKIETGNLKLEAIDVDLKKLVSKTLNSLQFRANEKGLNLSAEIDPRIPDAVQGDSTRLYQILINLLDNAIKFTETGEVKLKLALLDTDAENVEIQFEIADTGIGIPEDKQQAIFDAYTQVGAHISRKYGGTGLGLAITRKLINLYNSDIFLESTPGKGSRFYFSIRFQICAGT